MYTKGTLASHIETVDTMENIYFKAYSGFILFGLYILCMLTEPKKLKIHYKGFNAISNAIYVKGVESNSK